MSVKAAAAVCRFDCLLALMSSTISKTIQCCVRLRFDDGLSDNLVVPLGCHTITSYWTSGALKSFKMMYMPSSVALRGGWQKPRSSPTLGA